MIRRRNKAGRFSQRGSRWTRDGVHGVSFASRSQAGRAKIKREEKRARNITWLLHFKYSGDRGFAVDVVVWSTRTRIEQLIDLARKHLPEKHHWFLVPKFFDGMSKGPLTDHVEGAGLRSFKKLR